jgi:cytochrome c biogenesis protein CcdA
MAIGTLGLAFLAGTLSVLSPCVLPLLPIVLGTAATEHRFAPFALAPGLALSFVAIGLFVATAGFAIGLDADVFRVISAALLMAIGTLLRHPCACRVLRRQAQRRHWSQGARNFRRRP